LSDESEYFLAQTIFMAGHLALKMMTTIEQLCDKYESMHNG